MKIDKSRFLLLTTSLAATATALAVATVACNSTSTSTDLDSGQPSTTPDGGDSGNPGSDGGTDAGGEQCLGTDGTAPMCSPTGEGGGDEDAGADGGTATVAKCQFECQSAVSTFKTGVAIAINTCLDNAVPDPTVEGACSNALPNCATEAIAKACDDDTAAAFCTEQITACGGGDDAGADGGASGITQDKCVAVAKALSGEGRTTLSTCIAEGNDCASCFATASGQPLP